MSLYNCPVCREKYNNKKDCKKHIQKHVKIDNDFDGIIGPYMETPQLWTMSQHDISTILDENENIYVTYFSHVHCDANNRKYHNISYFDEKRLGVYNGEDYGLLLDYKKVLNQVIENERNNMIEYYKHAVNVMSSKHRKILHAAIISLQKPDSDYIDIHPYITLKIIRKAIMGKLKQFKHIHNLTTELVIAKFSDHDYPTYKKSIISSRIVQDEKTDSDESDETESSSEESVSSEKCVNSKTKLKNIK